MGLDFYLVFLHFLVLHVACTHLSDQSWSNIAINCGSIGESVDLDGREWIGDVGLESLLLQYPKGKSIGSIASVRSVSVDPIPYMTARVSYTEFHYSFQVSPGQKFIRLHFVPDSYKGFHKAKGVFTVKAGPYTLLENFSPLLSYDAASGAKIVVREFCMNVQDNEGLNITFIPSKYVRSWKSFAFINGIEIQSMPTGLYYTGDGDSGIRVVGQKYWFRVDNNTALQMVYKMNIGGRYIPAIEDSGLFRQWHEDTDYLLESGLLRVNYAAHLIIKESSLAPAKVYQTSWSRGLDDHLNKMAGLRWKILLETGFEYLVRLHFCEVEPQISESGHRRFMIMIDGQTVENMADVIKWSGGKGIPVHRDYVLMLNGANEVEKKNVMIDLKPMDQSAGVLLNGIEIFKLSNPEFRFSSPRLIPLGQHRGKWPMPWKLVMGFGSVNYIMASLFAILTLVNIVVYNIKKTWEANITTSKIKFSSSREQVCRLFSLSEIQLATRNFSDALVIGRGGFGRVYKGYIDDGSVVVAIKRLSSISKQGAHEFWTEIETLSKLRHSHLVSLIGYCKEGREMILVYEYIPHGALSRHLHLSGGNADNCHLLSWEQRLKICIGAARGLEYLHNGSGHGIIHRDVKAANILLDENFVAKISDFGLVKLENFSSLKSHISTKVKGTYGYLDPQYFATHKLTRKADVYAFGVVLFEVLSGRHAVDFRLPEDECNLASWAQGVLKDGKVEHIVAETLKGQIMPNILFEFVKIAEKCLSNLPRNRPTMAQVVASLELTLQHQESTSSEEVINHGQPSNTRQLFGPENEMIGVIEHGVLSPPRQSVMDNQFVEIPSRKAWSPKRRKNPTSEGLFHHWPWKKLRIGQKPQKRKLRHDEACIRVSLEDIQFNQILDKLGDRHSFTCEYIISSTRRVAIKQLTYAVCEADMLGMPCAMEKLSTLKHPNLVSFIGYCYSENKMRLIYDYPCKGPLNDYIYYEANNNNNLSWNLRLQICIGIAEGLSYLHSDLHRIVHRNLTTANILLDDNWVPRITNFELSLVTPLSYPDFLPEDFLAGTPEKSDIYSFGVILLEVLFGRRAISQHAFDTQRYLPEWIKYWIEKERFIDVIDAHLLGKISVTSLRETLLIAFNCLILKATERPSIGYVLVSLKRALYAQELAKASEEYFWVSSDLKSISQDILYQQVQAFPVTSSEWSDCMESFATFDSDTDLER